MCKVDLRQALIKRLNMKGCEEIKEKVFSHSMQKRIEREQKEKERQLELYKKAVEKDLIN